VVGSCGDCVSVAAISRERWVRGDAAVTCKRSIMRGGGGDQGAGFEEVKSAGFEEVRVQSLKRSGCWV